MWGDFMKSDRIYKNIRSSFIVFGSLSFILLVVISSLNHSYKKDFVHDMSNIVELVRTSNNNAITFGELMELKDDVQFAKVSGKNEIATGVDNGHGIYESGIKAVLADENYISFYNMQMLFRQLS